MFDPEVKSLSIVESDQGGFSTNGSCDCNCDSGCNSGGGGGGCVSCFCFCFCFIGCFK